MIANIARLIEELHVSVFIGLGHALFHSAS